MPAANARRIQFVGGVQSPGPVGASSSSRMSVANANARSFARQMVGRVAASRIRIALLRHDYSYLYQKILCAYTTSSDHAHRPISLNVHLSRVLSVK
jgi:hypothetical protein